MRSPSRDTKTAAPFKKKKKTPLASVDSLVATGGENEKLVTVRFRLSEELLLFAMKEVRVVFDLPGVTVDVCGERGEKKRAKNGEETRDDLPFAFKEMAKSMTRSTATKKPERALNLFSLFFSQQRPAILRHLLRRRRLRPPLPPKTPRVRLHPGDAVGGGGRGRR